MPSASRPTPARRFATLASTAAVVAFLFPGAGSALASGTISGHVTDFSNDQPVTGVCVQAIGQNVVGTAITDGTGAYTINANAGGYIVEFAGGPFCFGQSGGYLSEFYNDQPNQASANSVTVTDGQTTPGIDASLVAGSHITGQVTDSSGNPLAGVCVSATSSDFGTFNAQTGANGDYDIGGLRASDYKVQFQPCSAGNYLPEYYNNKPTQSAADPVHVTAGSTTPGIDAILAAGATITGQVTDASSGSGLSGICVQAANLSAGSPFFFPGAGVSTNATGHYTISGLAAGSYALYFSPCMFSPNAGYLSEYYHDEFSVSNADTVPVATGATVTNIDQGLVHGGSISGHVTDSSNNPVTNACAFADGPTSNSAQTDSNGNYTIPNLVPGSYTVRLSNCSSIPTATNYAPQYYNGKDTQAAADQVTVTSGQNSGGIDGTLGRGATISGRITDASSNAVAGCAAAILPDGSFESIAFANSNGNYTLQGLGTGDHVIGFNHCEGLSATEYYHHKHTFATADPVHTIAGQDVAGIDESFLPADTTPPDTTITSGPSGTSNQTSAAFTFDSSEVGSTFECKLDTGAWASCTSPQQYGSLTDGSHTFSVRATDAAGNTDQSEATRAWTVDTSSSSSTTTGTAPDDGTVTDDPAGNGPSPDAPVTTGVTTPTGGGVSITATPNATQSPPGGYGLFGDQVQITAPAASVADPLRLVFTVDGSAIPPATDLSTVSVLRDGQLAGDCTGSGTATPDPCVAGRETLANGDFRITILSAHASTWNLVGSSVPRKAKQSALTDLQAALPTANKADGREISTAIKDLNAALDSALWVNDFHIDSQHGNKVFDSERDAVDHLGHVNGSAISADKSLLVDADRKLASVEIGDGSAATPSPKHAKDVANELGQASEELTAGDAERSKGHLTQAIDRYKSAWQHAEIALEDAAKH